MKTHIILFLLVFFGFTSVSAFEPIPITISDTMSKVTFDGKWSFETEWKQSSLNMYYYENEQTVVLRSAHQDDFMYIFLDPITDFYPEIGKDRSLICFDTKNDKNSLPDSDDYCFVSTLGSSTGLSFRGNANGTKGSFIEIPNHDGFIASSAISDENDRYVGIPHPSYEFKIPTSVIGRNNIYGFYFVVYDEHFKKYYTYPQNVTTTDLFSSPSSWGEVYSPDKSLPELELPLLSMMVSISSAVLFVRIRHKIF